VPLRHLFFYDCGVSKYSNVSRVCKNLDGISPTYLHTIDEQLYLIDFYAKIMAVQHKAESVRIP